MDTVYALKLVHQPGEQQHMRKAYAPVMLESVAEFVLKFAVPDGCTTSAIA